MFIDDTIIAGVLVVVATLGCLVGLAVFVYKDAHKNTQKKP